MSLDTKYIYCPPNVDFSTSYGISEAEISKICAKVDYFNNDKAELQALLKKPISFLIIGKPGTGKSTIARKFSKIWNSFNISCANIVQFSLDLSKDVINDQNNSKKSEMDSSIRDILESGNSITEENAVKLIYQFTNSQICKNSGINPIKLIKENDEEEQIEEEMEEVEEEFDPELEDNQNKENSAANFKNTDDYRIENPIKGNKIIPHKIIQRLVCPPEFETLHIKRELDNYNNFMLPLIENLIMEYDHEKIIDIDGNKSIDEIIKSISWRLKSLGHYPSPMAKLLSDNGDTDGQESTNELSSIPIGSEEEVEDILRITSCKNTIYPTYRWRRSKWKCVCPVALAEGVFTNGRSELAYSYLDKMYFLSNHERARKFCENPRRYLVPNMPRKPIKMFICGPQLSGKSSLCYILAHFYECTVINMNMEMEEYLKKNEADYLDKSRSESFESAIGEVSTKLNHTLQEIWKGILSEREERENDLEIGLDDEDEEIKIETENKNSHNEIEVDNENGNQFEIKPENENKIEKELEKELEKETKDESIEEKYIISEKIDRLNLTTLELVKSDLEKITNEPQAMEYIVQKCLEIDETHQEVVEIVNKLMIDASRSIPKIAPEIYKNVLEERIKTIEEARRIKLGLDHPYLQGGWIVDNYPISKEYFSVLTDSLVMPDQFIKLFDGSIEFNSILTQVELEQKKQDIEIEKENEIVIENEVGKHDANDQVITKDGEVDTSQIAEEEQVVGQVDETPLEKEEKNVSFADEKDELETFSDLSMDNNFIVKFSVFYNFYNFTYNSFKYDAWETQALDIDEDDQDIENERILLESTENINEDSEEEEEELVEESIDPNRSPNKKLGDTNYFCPVRMKNKNVLVPSNSEISARYKEKIYYLSTVEAREAFVKNPNNYISLDKPQKIPAPRIFIIGVKASGKTLHGQEVARRENIFYINFRNVLQNMLFQKTKTFIGPEYFPMDEKTENFSDTDEETNENPVNPENSENVNFANESTEKLRKQSVVYDEDEEAIKAYLESEEPMSNELLDKIILQWWNKEPYRSKGFIMEGFPRTVEEVYYIQDRAIFADVTIIMSCDSTEIVSRLIPKRVEKWIDKKNKKDGKMKIKKEKQRQLRLETIEKRRIELTEKKMEKFKEKSNEETNSNDQNSENEDENRSEEEEESIDEEGEQTEEEARDRFQTDIEEIYENEISRISNVEERLNEIMLPCITIESDRKPHITRYRFNKEIAKYLKNRESFCERVYSITETVANDMLSTGYKFISRFNRWCPVSLSNNDYIQSNNQDENAIAAEYRNYIYFFKSLEKRDIFMTNPLFYVNHIDVTSRPLVPIKLCVIGPPKSGKTTLVKKIVKMYGITKLSMGDVLKKVLNENEESVLNIQLKHILQMGKVVPDILKIAALERVVAEMDCVNKGLLTERWIIPGKIFELDLPVEEIIKRATIERYRDDKEHPKHDSANMFAIRLATWNKEISDVRRWYIREHENYVKVDASKSKWFISNTVSLSVNDSIKKIQEYVQGLQNERAAIIDGLCIRPSDFQNQLGGYKNYCPVSFLNDDELVDLQNRKGHELDVEYKGYYYRIENSEKLIKFLNNAEYYIAAFNERSLPISKLLPVVLSDNQKSNTQFNIMFNGYCPVTYVEGDKSYDNIKKGNESILAKYNEKVYSFLNMQTLDKFMRKPHKYSNLELPCKLPPDAVNIKLNKLPMSGYLEQTMADQLICSLSSLAQWKPKRPFLSVKESAIFYLACHMKATNPKSSSYIKHLNMSRIELLKESTIIIDYLAKNMTKKFITQENRPKDFDLNMQVFKGFEQFIRKPLN
ncbi:hypothetical protein A3Q56_02552 [Intoshia linei]|uniref:Adenylate kinase 9-like n=1 Tax=Intoshia linei TaxID=1819745 RepID=A0A177B5R8_9BILA|nr:hypothetical protein A3Q56_02552 [Intoshia linei]